MGCGRDIIITSCARTQEAVHFARQQGCSLSSQAELYYGWSHGLPGYNPANPPGVSTHEFRNDGAAYAVPRGTPLKYWQVGIDNGNSPLLIARAHERRWIATLTYPTSPSERHHVNFRREPILVVFKNLKHGSRGPRVAAMTRSLRYLGFLDVGEKGTGRFDREVERALWKFQHSYHLPADGVFGVRTSRQLKTANRSKKQERKAAMKIKDHAKRERELERIGAAYGPARDD
jgi:peptidoglycan hydrolase-like protein with peptidoglycan-binding domain